MSLSSRIDRLEWGAKPPPPAPERAMPPSLEAWWAELAAIMHEGPPEYREAIMASLRGASPEAAMAAGSLAAPPVGEREAEAAAPEAEARWPRPAGVWGTARRREGGPHGRVDAL